MSISNQQLLQRYAQPIRVSTSVDDTNAPFSFQTWYSVYQGIIPNQEFKQYNEYLVNWYKDKNQLTTDALLQLKLNYLTLLRQLQVFFTFEEAENWYNQVNIENEKELLLAIPYFARKLRDISLYYLQLRNSIKESKLLYNQIGTETGLTQQIQKFILTNYTQKPVNSITLPAVQWKNAPALSSVKETINVEIKELYDTGSYFDHSPTLPVSAYHDINSTELQNFLARKGLDTPSIDWIYKLGIYELSASSLSANNAADITYPTFVELSKQIAQKYLGSDKYVVTQPVISTSSTVFDVPLEIGNNYFYWPFGAYKDFAKTSIRYQDIPLSATGIENLATAGETLETADTIFVKTIRGIKGAWLRYEPFVYTSNVMGATLDAQATTVFRFPFPGYGLSAEDIPWTGYSLSSDPRFFYLDQDLQQLVLNEYWTNSSNLTSCKTINLNDTTLVTNKAYSNKSFNLADKITVWANPPSYNSSVFSGESKQAWLYRFDKTDISIKGNGNSTIYWPYNTLIIEPEPQTLTNYTPQNINDVCLPLPLSAIDFSFATAGNDISNSDVIYKVNNFLDTPEDATECFWLSGNKNTYTNNIGKVQQNSLQGIFQPGTFTQFTWEGPNNTLVRNVFPTLQHQPDCPYVNTPNIEYDRFDLCTCKQVNFTPFGHPGRTFTDNSAHCDFIYEGTAITNFDITTWKDSTNVPYLSSRQFFWYKTDNKPGWGSGRWATAGAPRNYRGFLQNGKTYTYYRATTRTQNKTLSSYPELVVRHSYNTYNSNYGKNHIWVQGTKTDTGEWVSSNIPSQAIMRPGEYLIYTRASNLTTEVTGFVTQPADIYENRGTVWSSANYVSVNSNIPITVAFPVISIANGTLVRNISAITEWALTPPQGRPIQYYRNTPGFSFYANLTGEYSLTVKVLTAAQIPGETGALVTITDIPKITAVSNTTQVPIITSQTISLPGYVLNTPLQGWNYRTSLPTNFFLSRDGGGKPFWAKTYIDKDENTKYKGIDRLGNPQRLVDQYNFISQPEISDIVLTPGSKISYERNYFTPLNWAQPVNLIVTSNKIQWCDLEFTTDSQSNLAKQLNNYKTELITNPTTTPSTLILENFVDNEPVEIQYNALNPFVWSIIATSEIPITTISDLSSQLAISTVSPWANLPNQTFPTVAAAPDTNNLFTTTLLGGYFVPKNLGASVYTEHDYLLTLSSHISSYFSQVEYSRGLSKQDQKTPYTFTVNNAWLKEPTVSGPIAGVNEKEIFKKYQKFIPYQSNYETNPRNRIGLLNPTSRQSPWTGKEDSEWGDTANHPRTFTGEVDVSKWAESQVLKKAKLQVDNWVTDIFGNQYGLYKDIKNVKPSVRKNITGEIWVRNNAQFVAPAYISLADVFDTYQNTVLIKELTGFGIQKIDMFFDTLMVQTSGAVLFEKINYDYVKNNIFSLTDEARYISLAMPVTASLEREFINTDLSLYNFAKCGETWFLPNEKLVYITVCGLKDNILTPKLYNYNINTLTLTKVFPNNQQDTNTINELSSLNLVTINPPVLSYEPSTKQFVYGISGKNNNNEDIIIQIEIDNLLQVILNNITVFTPQFKPTLLEPPAVLDDLNINLIAPNPRGIQYSTTSTQYSALSSGLKIVIENNIDQSLQLATSPVINGNTTYPLSSFNTLTGIDDIVFQQPFLNNYTLYSLDPLYIQQYGDEVLYSIAPLNFTCTNILNTPAVFAPVNLPDWINLSSNGTFTGIPPTGFNFETFSGSFKVTNDVGPTFYSLNINIVYDN